MVRKDGLPEKAREIIDNLRFDFKCQYDEKDSIGKRYRRQDAIGTPFCVTVDHQTLEDNTVTIRFRDSMEQQRVAVDQLQNIIGEQVSLKTLLKKIVDKLFLSKYEILRSSHFSNDHSGTTFFVQLQQHGRSR